MARREVGDDIKRARRMQTYETSRSEGLSDKELTYRIRETVTHDLQWLGEIVNLPLPSPPLKFTRPSWSIDAIIQPPRLKDPVTVSVSWSRHSGILYLNGHRWIIRPSQPVTPKPIWSLFDRLDNHAAAEPANIPEDDMPSLEVLAGRLSFELEKGLVSPVEKILSPVDVFFSAENRNEIMDVLRIEARERGLRHLVETRIVVPVNHSHPVAFRDPLVDSPMIRFRAESDYFPQMETYYYNGSFFFCPTPPAKEGDSANSLAPFTPTRVSKGPSQENAVEM